MFQQRRRRQWKPTPVLLPGKSRGQRSLVGCSPWGHKESDAKSRTWLSDFTFTFHFHVLEREMATHSSVLAWRIPGMGEPGGLPSMGSHRVGHDWSDAAAAAAAGVKRDSASTFGKEYLLNICSATLPMIHHKAQNSSYPTSNRLVIRFTEVSVRTLQHKIVYQLFS